MIQNKKTSTITQIVKALAVQHTLTDDCWETLCEKSVRDELVLQGLSSLVYPLLSRQQKNLMKDASAFFKERYENALLHKDIAVQLLRQLAPDLCTGGRVVLVQGLGLAHGIYEEPMAREMGDIDIYLPDGNAEKIRDVLKNQGFSPLGTYKNTWYYQGVCIDIHECLWGEDRLPCRRFVAPIIPVEFLNSSLISQFYILAPHVMALHCAFHGLKHAMSRAIWWLDLILLQRKGYFPSQYTDPQATNIVSCALEFLRNKRLFDKRESGLEKEFSSSKKCKVVQKLLARASHEGRGEIVLALLCRAPQYSAAYIWQSMFPPQNVLVQMYGHAGLIQLLIKRVFALLRLSILNRTNR